MKDFFFLHLHLKWKRTKDSNSHLTFTAHFWVFYGNIQSFRFKEKKWQISKNLSKALIYFFSRFFVTLIISFFFPSQNRKWLPNIRKLSQGRTSEKSSDATSKNLPVNRESSKPNFKVGNFYQIVYIN